MTSTVEPKYCEHCGRQFFRRRGGPFPPARYCPPCVRLLVNAQPAEVDFDAVDRARGLRPSKPRGTPPRARNDEEAP